MCSITNDHDDAWFALTDIAIQTVDEQQQIIRECHQLISKRSDHACNFLDGGSRWGKVCHDATRYDNDDRGTDWLIGWLIG
jgi:hypothetical protein